MDIMIYSDLHVEFNGDFPLPPNNVDVIVLAGDIINIRKESQRNKLKEFCKGAEDVPVLYVLGNHEHYGSSIEQSFEVMREMEQEVLNLHVLENESFYINGVVFHGCTLWTGFNALGEPYKAIGKIEALRSHSTLSE